MSYAIIAPLPLLGQYMQQLQLLQLQLDNAPVELWLLAKNGAPLDQKLPMDFQHIRYIHVEDDGLTQTQLQGLTECFMHNPMDGLFFIKAPDSAEFAIRLAMRLDGSYDSNIEYVSLHKGSITTQKSIFDGIRIKHNELHKKPFCIAMDSMRKSTVPQDANQLNHHSIPISYYGPYTITQPCLQHYCYMRPQSNSSLANAIKILLVGQGVGSAEAVNELAIWAKKHHMQLGITRAVMLNGWATAELLVGASGQIVTPELCIAVGVSGADALYYGIRHSNYLVAINTDASAPIMRKCHLAIHGDWQLLHKL